MKLAIIDTDGDWKVPDFDCCETYQEGEMAFFLFEDYNDFKKEFLSKTQGETIEMLSWNIPDDFPKTQIDFANGNYAGMLINNISEEEFHGFKKIFNLMYS